MADNFSIQMDGITKKVFDRAERVIRKAILDMYGEIILKSPVDTGLFRSNNQLTIGSVAPGVLFDETPKPGKTYPPPSIDAAKVANFRIDSVAFICNNLRYAKPIEFGWSKQAPAGVYRLAALKFGSFLNNALSSIKE